jgi:hypothetical protein
VQSEAHFHQLLQYVKPIDLLGPYDRGYRAAKADGKVELLHREVREFFDALTIETTEYQGGDFKKSLMNALEKNIPKPLWKAVRKRWEDILVEIVTKPVTEPLSKVLTEAITKTLKKPLAKPLKEAITKAAHVVQQRKVMLVTRRRFLYGGNCHGSSKHPLGLKEAVRRTQAHQEAIRERVSMAREAEAHCREVADSQPME